MLLLNLTNSTNYIILICLWVFSTDDDLLDNDFIDEIREIIIE